jgi:alkanesulfonate monooxygenase SsuD/methylene tetrahydromethanopterin reductase-like flavin-dependent oxidoreductase (luciferase family)
MAAPAPLLSIFLSHLDHLIEGRNARLIGIAQACEGAGADQVVFSEHVALAQRIEGQGEAAKFPFQSDENYPEPLVSLAAIAGATRHIRLATGILIAPLRPAILLAKMAATLDHLCDGRLDLGFGSGWHAPEFEAEGLDPARGMEILEDTIGACRALWAGGPSSFSSGTVRFERLYCRPVPLRGRDLPVWLAGPPTGNAMRQPVRR